MTDDDGLSFAQCMDQTDDVGREMEYVVRLNGLRRVRLPIAPLIRSHDMITSLCELGYLVPPGIPGFGPAMAKDDEWSCALFGEMHPDSVALNGAPIYRHEDLQGRLGRTAWADLKVVRQQKLLQSAV
jgi:hypothetical protein